MAEFDPTFQQSSGPGYYAPGDISWTIPSGAASDQPTPEPAALTTAEAKQEAVTPEWFAHQPEGSTGYWYVSSEPDGMGDIATVWGASGDAEQHAKQLAAAPKMLAALRKSHEGMRTWLAIFADDQCSESAVAEAQERIHAHGTVYYIAEVFGAINAAISKATGASS